MVKLSAAHFGLYRSNNKNNNQPLKGGGTSLEQTGLQTCALARRKFSS
jgi:hypothetical protein